MPAALIVHDPSEFDRADPLARDLRRRGYVVHQTEYMTGVRLQVAPRSTDRDSLVAILITPHASRSNGANSLARSHLEFLLDAGLRVVVIAPLAEEFDQPHLERIHGIVRSDAPGKNYDTVFADLFRYLVGAYCPSWLDVECRPSQVQAPTGVGWWSDDLIVADERYEHVVRTSPDSTSVLVPGLREPHHIAIDRRKLLVANKGANEILLADIVGELASNIRSISSINGQQLSHPTAVHQSHHVTVIADTDHHRVLATRDDVWEAEQPSWYELRPNSPFFFPCGLFIDDHAIWVADTFNHRIIVFDHDGRQLGEFGSYGSGDAEFSYPVNIVSWQGYILVADEAAERIQIFRRLQAPVENGHTYTELALALVEPNFGRPWLGTPFGLSINRERQLAIGDRERRCIWRIDLQTALQELESAPAGTRTLVT